MLSLNALSKFWVGAEKKEKSGLENDQNLKRWKIKKTDSVFSPKIIEIRVGTADGDTHTHKQREREGGEREREGGEREKIAWGNAHKLEFFNVISVTKILKDCVIKYCTFKIQSN